jgi:hypothetical protein
MHSNKSTKVLDKKKSGTVHFLKFPRFCAEISGIGNFKIANLVALKF